MLFTQMISYAIEVLALLAAVPAEKAVTSRQLALVLQIPPQYLSKVMTHLVKKKFVTSATGPTGGFSLAIEPSKVTLYRIMASLDAVQTLEDECVMGLGKCSSATPCALHDGWTAFKQGAIEKAQQLTLNEISGVLLTKLRVRFGDSKLTIQGLVESAIG